MCRLKVRFSQSSQRRGVFNYALKVEVTDATGIPSKIFVYHQSPAGVEENTFAEFDHIATPVDFQEIPEDAASEIVPWYRTDKCTVWFRSVSDLVLAKQLFVDDINALTRTYNVLTSENGFRRQTSVEFSENGVHEAYSDDEDTIQKEIDAMKKDISGKVSKDAMSGVEVETNTTEGIRNAVKQIGNTLGAKIVKTVVLALSVLSIGASALGAGFSGEHFAQIDLDENPVVVTNVTFDGLATLVDITNVVDSISTNFVPALRREITEASVAGTNYVDSATNEVMYAVDSKVSTNDFINATNDVYVVLSDKATKADATLTDANTWIFADGLLEAALENIPVPEPEESYLAIVTTSQGYDAVIIVSDGGHQEVCAVNVNVRDARISFGPDWVTAVFPDGSVVATRAALQGYTLGSQTDKPLASEAEAEALRTGKLDKADVVAPSPSATAGQAANAKATGDALAGKASKADLDPLLFAQYYPDGSVKSVAEFTPGIKYYAPNTVNRTITVRPFCDTVSSANNSGLIGRVVIPPFVDVGGYGYISDNGKRYKVVGVHGGSPRGVNTNLTAIVAPSTVTTIGVSAFSDCTSLASVSLPSATSIGVGAFYGCTSLASVSLPSATTIGDSAFDSCTSLASVSLPSATSIGVGAFYSCTSLASVDFGDTPRLSVPSLDRSAFYNVPSTCTIIVPYTQYDAWIAAENWRDLQQEFVRHPEKADKPTTFTTGNLAKFDNAGNPTDSGKSFEDIQSQIDTESPLLARSFAVQRQSGWREASGATGTAGNSVIFFRPRYFGMKDGDLFKGIVLQTRADQRTVFSNGVYMRLRAVPADQSAPWPTLGVSDLTVWPDTPKTDVVFRLPRAVSLPSSGSYYALDFVLDPDGGTQAFGMMAYGLQSGSNPDFYFALSTIVPVATAQFYSWEELTGADIAVSSTDATKIDAALGGKLDKSGGTVTGDISMPNGQLDAGDVVTRSYFDFSRPSEGSKYLDAPENSGKALTDADIQDSSSALGAALADKLSTSGGVNLRNDPNASGRLIIESTASGRLKQLSIVDDVTSGQAWELCTTGSDPDTIVKIPIGPGTLALTAGTGHAGNLAALDANGNPTDSGIAKTNVATKADIYGKLDSMEAIAWSDLKAKRDVGKLVPGQQYRIMDYVATTSGDMESQSANHPFDIIVTADDEHTLNEHARAIMHDGDLPDDIVTTDPLTDKVTRTKYFAECNLAAWDVWYCLDNDTNRFAWADTSTVPGDDPLTDAPVPRGRGVIYRLVDEFQNDCPYDFKGIQFKAYGDTDNVWRYTFDSGDASGNTDFSLHGGTSGDVQNWVFSNKILPYHEDATGVCLNRIVFKGSNCYSNTFDPDCYSNTFGSNCVYNMFGSNCGYNMFGSNCDGNTFGSNCVYNMFGSDCVYNMFGSDCNSNTFGSNCGYNMFGSNCNGNTFGSNCVYNMFGSDCQYTKFGNASVTKSYCRYIRVASGNQYLYINPTGNTTDSAYYQNVEIVEGVNNTTTYKTIDDPNVNQNFKTTYQPANSEVISI